VNLNPLAIILSAVMVVGMFGAGFIITRES
jgi:hypothetical protein